MKQAPSRVTSVDQALNAEVLDKPYIYWSTYWHSWYLVPSASRSRNTKAINFITRVNNAAYKLKRKEAEDAKAPQIPLLVE
jgi:hypothetical protein